VSAVVCLLFCVQFGLGAQYVLQQDVQFLSSLGSSFAAGECCRAAGGEMRQGCVWGGVCGGGVKKAGGGGGWAAVWVPGGAVAVFTLV
jgi:hypothetical protein